MELDLASWQRITAYADVGITVPATLVMCVWLLAARAWLPAFWWLFWFCLGLGLVVASKLGFIGWGIGIQALDFAGFSGHAMRAAIIAPVALFLIPWPEQHVWRWRSLALGIGIALGGVIGYSRLVVGAHSVAEAVSGTMLGAVCAVGFVWCVRRQLPLQIPKILLAASFIALILLPGISKAPTQSWLIGLAMDISGHDRPFLRECWCFPAEPWRTPEDRDGWRKRPVKILSNGQTKKN